MSISTFSPTIRRKEMDAVLTSMVNDTVGPGEYVHRLVQIAKEYISFDYGLALRSPAVALYYALKALDIPQNSGVLISALSPRYYLLVLQELQLKPVLCDVAEETGNMDEKTVSAAITAWQSMNELPVRCMIVHHTLGYIPDMELLQQLGVPIIEDCSHSFGTIIGNTRAGSYGVFSILGMEEKDVITAGGGALLFASSRRDASVLRQYATLPEEYLLPDMNAALAIIQFKESEKNYQKRKEIASAYQQAVLRTRHKRFIQTGDGEYNNYTFPLIIQTGVKDVITYSAKKDIIVEQAFDGRIITTEGIDPQQYPVAYSLLLRTVLFPLYPRLTGTQVSKITRVLATLP